MKSSRNILGWCLIFTGINSSPAIAQSTGEKSGIIDEIIVTSSRIPISRSRLATSVTQLVARDIEEHGNLQLTDVLRQTTSVSVSSNGAPGKVGSLRIRGEEGFRTLTLFDGIRLSDPGNVQVAPHMEHLLSGNVHSVEILRGPQGLGYGADAGGVINIASPDREPGLHWNADYQAGSYAGRQLNTNVSGGNEHAGIYVGYSDYRNDGYNISSVDTVLQDNDGYANSTLHVKADLELSDTLELMLVHRQTDSDSAFDYCFDSGFSLIHSCNSRYEHQADRVQLQYSGEAVAHAFSYSESSILRNSYANAQPAFSAIGEVKRWEYLGSVTSIGMLDYVFGADYEKAQTNDTGRSNSGVFAEVLGNIAPSLHLALALRHDRDDAAVSNNSYRFSAAWLHELSDAQTLKVRGSLGSGFRAPSPFEVSYNQGAFAFPPASTVTLQQETSRGYELGVEYAVADSLWLEAVYFKQDIVDAISFDLAGFSGYLQEVGNSDSRGIELSGFWQFAPGFRLQGNATWNHTRQPDGQTRLRRPGQLFNAGIVWQGEGRRLHASAFLRAAHNSVDEQFGTRVQLEDYQVLDLTTGWRLSSRLELFARVENTLNERYQEVLGYNTPGRTGWLGFRLALMD